MEIEKVIKVLLGMMFLVLILIIVLVCLIVGNSEKNIPQKIIINSYNTIDNPNKVYYQNDPFEEVTYSRAQNEEITQKVYAWENWGEKSIKDPKDYDSRGKHIKTYEAGFYVDTYKVYIQNRALGDYFTVRFYFEDYAGNERSYDIRKYITHNDEQLFYYRDISKDRYKYYDWRYVVYT